MAHLKKVNIENLLREHQLKSTPQRLAVLKVFLENNKVLNLASLNKLLEKNFVRITLYRTLNSFEEKGLIHKIPDKEIASYALCKHDSIAHSHEDNHAHFKCTKCLLTQCLDEVQIPKITLPKKFTVQKFNFIIEGICEDCKKK